MKKLFFILSVLCLFLCSASVFAGYTNTDTVQHQRVLFIPNAFSPNGDGMNDFFKIVNLESEKVERFSIFNKWGTTLYESKANDAAWDGTYRGKPQDQGEYGYVIVIRFPNNVTEVYKGVVFLLRN